MRPRRSYAYSKAEHGLTLGEMLIVLAVFSILAILFIFSSSYAINKSKHSRSLQDLRTLVMALDHFMVSHSRLPTEDQGLKVVLQDPANDYISRMPVDPFRSSRDPSQGYAYFVDLGERHRAVIVGVGPDGDLDLEQALDGLRDDTVGLAVVSPHQFVFDTPGEAQTFIAEHSYDPTNGSVSDGDIIISYFGY